MNAFVSGFLVWNSSLRGTMPAYIWGFLNCSPLKLGIIIMIPKGIYGALFEMLTNNSCFPVISHFLEQTNGGKEHVLYSVLMCL